MIYYDDKLSYELSSWRFSYGNAFGKYSQGWNYDFPIIENFYMYFR